MPDSFDVFEEFGDDTDPPEPVSPLGSTGPNPNIPPGTDPPEPVSLPGSPGPGPNVLPGTGPPQPPPPPPPDPFGEGIFPNDGVFPNRPIRPFEVETRPPVEDITNIEIEREFYGEALPDEGFDVALNDSVDPLQRVSDLCDDVGNGLLGFDQEIRSNVQRRVAEAQASMGRFTSPIRTQLTGMSNKVKAAKQELDIGVLTALTGELAEVIERTASELPGVFEDVIAQPDCPDGFIDITDLDPARVREEIDRLTAECRRLNPGQPCFIDRVISSTGNACMRVVSDVTPPPPPPPPPPPFPVPIPGPIPGPIPTPDPNDCDPGFMDFGQASAEVFADIDRLFNECVVTSSGGMCSFERSIRRDGKVCVRITPPGVGFIGGTQDGIWTFPPCVPPCPFECLPGWTDTGVRNTQLSSQVIDAMLETCQAANPTMNCCVEFSVLMNDHVCVRVFPDVTGTACPDDPPPPPPPPPPGPGPTPDPGPGPGPTPDPCPSPEQDCIRLCPDEEEEECPPSVTWHNCFTGAVQCLPEGEEPEGDDWEEGPLPVDCIKVWFNCDTGIFQVTTGPFPPSGEPEEAEGFVESPWTEVGDKTIDDICRECFEEDEDDEDGDPGGPKFDPAAACSFLAPGLVAALAGPFSFAKLLQPPTDRTQLDSIPLTLAGWIKLAFPGLEIKDELITPILDGMMMGITNRIQSWFSQTGCNQPQHLGLRVAQTVLGLLRQYLGEGFDDLLIPVRNQARFMCPTDSPTAAEADAAFLTDEIDGDVWKCWVRAKNQDDTAYAAVLRSKQSRLGPNELVQLLRRKKITAAQFDDRIRELGYLRGDEKDSFFELSRQLPPITDLLRMMVRDAADEQAVDRNRFDEDFQKKWAGQVKDWGEEQGIDEDFAKFVWRSHWTLPAPGQLAEMFHRGQFLDPNDERHVTLDEIRETLKQQDVAPRWVDAFINTTFRLIPQRVLRRALRFGIANDQESFEQFRQQGFDNRNANIMVQLSKREAKDIALRTKWMPDFVQGRITESEFGKLLEQDGVSTDYNQDILQRAEILTDRRRRGLCIKSLRTRFLDAEFDEGRAVNELTALQVAPTKAATIAAGWKCERDAQSRQVTAATLCRWLEDKLITPADFVLRLERLHYTRANAEAIVESCRLKLTRKELAAEKKEQKQEEAEQAKLEAKANRAANAAKKRANTRASRERKLLRSAGSLVKTLETDLPETLDFLKSLFNNLRSPAGVDPDDVLAAIDSAVKDPSINNFTGVENLAISLMSLQPVVTVPTDLLP